MTAVDEEQGERRRPERGDGCAAADDGDDVVLEPGRPHRAAEERQRVDRAPRRVDELRVVPFPAGLVLLGAAMVVDGDRDSAACPGCRAEKGCRLAAVG